MFKRKERQISDSEAKKALPHNRKEVFFDLLRHRKMTLFALSTFTFMFFIPLAVDLFGFNFLENVAIANEKYEYLNEELKLGISQQSINSMTYIMNQENGIDNDETMQLIADGFIASDAADVFPQTLETTNVINNNNALTTEDDTRKVKDVYYSL